MKPVWLLAVLLVGRAALAGDGFAYGEWDRLLKKYVDAEGRVAYAALQSDAADRAAFARVVASVAASRERDEAFYLDAYNVLVWRGVFDRLPGLTNVDRVKASFFVATTYVVGGKAMNLTALENDLIRATFKDPRVHFALNCASGGCPRLPAEAFTPARLDAQLDREARRFCSEPRNVAYDAATRTARLSHIFDWYRDDFGKEPARVLAFINKWRAAPLPLDARIEYRDYDWTLNDPNLRR